MLISALCEQLAMPRNEVPIAVDDFAAVIDSTAKTGSLEDKNNFINASDKFIN